MEKQNVNTKKYNILKLVLLSILIVIITFPKYEPVISPGLDISYFWAINYSIFNNIHLGRDVLLTYGPLGFLAHPLHIGYNLTIAIIINSFIQFCFIFSLLYIGQKLSPKRIFITIPITILFSLLFTQEYGLIIVTACTAVLFEKSHKYHWLIIGVLASVLGAYIKSSIGVLSLLILISSVFYELYRSRKLKSLLILSASYILITLLLWVILYHGFNGLIRYFTGLFWFVAGNSEAMSIFPSNNWWLLAASLIILILIPIIVKDKTIRYLYLIFGLSLFAMWRYAMVREDCSHLRSGLFYFLLIFSGLLIITVQHKKYLLYLLITAMLVLFGLNIPNCVNYHKLNLDYGGIKNFYNTTFQYKKLVNESQRQTTAFLKNDLLSDSVAKLLVHKTVDIYPWNSGYIVAGNLNWKPKPVFQSYLSYSAWLDKQNERFFLSVDIPDYLIWEFTLDNNGNEFGSIDNRYLLNDEPDAILYIASNYSVCYKNQNILLLRKTDKNTPFHHTLLPVCNTSWDKWITTPEAKSNILRVNIKIGYNLYGNIKKFLYKGEEFYIEYQLDDGTILRYRIIPDNSGRGIWINPLYGFPTINIHEHKVIKIRFCSSNPHMMKNQIPVIWDNITINHPFGFQ